MKRKIISILAGLFLASNVLAQATANYVPVGETTQLRKIPGTTLMYTAEQADNTFLDSTDNLSIKTVSSDNPGGEVETHSLSGNPTFTIEGPVNPDWAQTNQSHRAFIKNKPHTIKEVGITNAVEITEYNRFANQTIRELSAVNGRVDDFEVKHDRDVANLNGTINNVSNTLSNTISTTKTELQTNINKLDTTLNTKINTASNDLNTAITTVNSNLNERIDTTSAELLQSISETKSELTQNITTNVQNLNTKIDNSVTTLNEKIDTKVDITTFNETTANLRTEIQNSSTAIREVIVNSTNTLHDTVSGELNTAISELNTELRSHVSDVSNVLSQATTAVSTDLHENYYTKTQVDEQHQTLDTNIHSDIAATNTATYNTLHGEIGTALGDAKSYTDSEVFTSATNSTNYTDSVKATLDASIQGVADNLSAHVNTTSGNPHNVTAHETGAYTQSEVDTHISATNEALHTTITGEINSILSTNVWQDDLGHGEYTITINNEPFVVIDANAMNNSSNNIFIPLDLDDLSDVTIPQEITDGQVLMYKSENGEWTTGTIVIPEQIHADWTQNDEHSITFIEHKPNINTANEESQDVLTNAPITGTIQLHKVASTGSFSNLVDRPSTIAGYDIEDAYTKTEIGNLLSTNAWKKDIGEATISLNTVTGTTTNKFDTFNANAKTAKSIYIPLPVVNDGSLTISVSGGAPQTLSETFTANQAGNTTVGIVVPTELKNLSDVDNALTSSNGQALVYDGTKWIAGNVNNVQVTPVAQDPGIKVATITVNGSGTDIEIPKSNSAYDNDAGYETDADVRRIEHNVNENQTTTINLSTDINEQIFKRGDNENTTNSIVLPEATEEKTGKVMIYVEEVPSKTFHYDFADDNLDVFTDWEDDEKPWLTNENDAMWLFTFTSVPGETTWHCDTFKEYLKPYVDPTIHSFTRAYYSDGTITDYDISGTIDSSSIDKNNLVGLEIGTNVTFIGNYAFRYCNSLESVIIGDSVANIGDEAFEGCERLESVTIGNSVTNIGNAVFYQCNSLINLSIPDSVTSVGNDAFRECANLTNVMIGDGLMNIGNRVFLGNTNMTSVIIGNNVTNIGNNAFWNCYNLTNVSIPNSVKTIETQVFFSCTTLSRIMIGNGVTNIGNNSFKNCNGLTTVNYVLKQNESEEDGLTRVRALMANKGINLSQITSWNAIQSP